MTDDLVERLLDWPYQGETMAHEAADRIEQLTAEAAKMLAEQDREYNRKTNDMIERHAEQVKALTAERDRLREALQLYATPCDATETSPCGYEGNMCCRTARAALKGETP